MIQGRLEVYQKPEKKQECGKKKKGNNKNQSQQVSDQILQNEQYKKELIEKFQQEKQEEDFPVINESQNIEEQKQDYEIKVNWIQEIVGEKYTKKQIKNALRDNSMNVDQTLEQLLNENKKQQSQDSSRSSGSGNKLTSKNKLSQDNLVYNYQNDSEGSLYLSQNSSEKDSAQKAQQYSQQIKQLKNLFPDFSNELLAEALEINQGDLEQTTDYLFQDDNIKSLELCIEEHQLNTKDVGDHLEQIINEIIDEEQQDEDDFMKKLSNQENDIDDLNIEEDLFISKIKKSMSKEEQQDPQIQKILIESLFYAKQMELLSKCNQKNSQQNSPEKIERGGHRLKGVELKKNSSQNYKLNLEYFKEEYIKNNSQKNKDKFDMNYSDFPSIIKQKSGPQGNIIKELQKGKQQEYNPNKNEWSQTVFQNEGISSLGQEYLQVLSTDFPHVTRDTLIDIFKKLSEDFEATKKFLKQTFGEYKIKRQVKIIKKKVDNQNDEDDNDSDDSVDNDQIIRQTIEKFQKKYRMKSFNEVREEIQNIYKYNKAYQFANRSQDNNAKFNLNKYFNGSIPLKELQDYSKALCLNEARSQDPIYKLDLHGFAAEEALDVLKNQILYMIDLARSKKFSKLKIQNNYIQLEIVTGRGSHSIGNISVLKPRVIEFLKRAKYNSKVEEGRVICKIPY